MNHFFLNRKNGKSKNLLWLSHSHKLFKQCNKAGCLNLVDIVEGKFLLIPITNFLSCFYWDKQFILSFLLPMKSLSDSFIFLSFFLLSCSSFWLLFAVTFCFQNISCWWRKQIICLQTPLFRWLLSMLLLFNICCLLQMLKLQAKIKFHLCVH